MTSRETARARRRRRSPALAAALLCVAPRRLVTRVARRRRVPRPRRSRWRWPRSRSRDPASRCSDDWLVVDAAGGLLVGVIGARRARQRARLARLPGRAQRTRSSRRRAPARASTTSSLFVFWAVLLAVPLAGNLGAAWLLSRRRPPPRRCSSASAASRARSRPAGSTCPDLARARRRAARDRHPRRRRPRRRARRALLAGAPDATPGSRDGARRLPAPARRAGRQDRLGAGAQLAARRPLRGAAARLRAALGGAAADGAARRLALRAGARPVDRRAHGAATS